MIADRHIENALKQALAAYTAIPKAWPNQAASVTVPYISVAMLRLSNISRPLTGGYEAKRGRIIATVIVAAKTGTDTANGHADAIANLFPKARVIPFTGGNIVITAPAVVKEGYVEGSEWRTPVLIDYLAE